MTHFTEISESRYHDMLGAVPPIDFDGKSFLVGEPFDHRSCTVTGRFLATYGAFTRKGERFYEAGAPLTRHEFKQLLTDQYSKLEG